MSRSAATAVARSLAPDAGVAPDPAVIDDGGEDAGAERGGGGAREEGGAVGGVDVVVQRLGDRVELGEVARDGGAGERLQRAELPAAGGEAGDRRRLPVDRRVGDDRLVAEHDLDLAVARGGDRDLPVLAEVVEDLVATVEQVVGALPGLDGGAIALLSCARLVAAALIGPVAPVRLSNWAVGVGAGLLDLRGQAADGVGQRVGGGVDGLLGAVGLGVVGQVGPGRVELAQQRVDARGRRLADGALHVVQRLGAGRGVAQRHVLRADLEVQEGVADAAVGGDVDARAEVRAGAVLRGAGRQVQRVGRAERGLLARVADGVGVGDVVGGDVESLLLGQKAAQRGLQSEEARDHDQACRSRVRKEACVLRPGECGIERPERSP